MKASSDIDWSKCDMQKFYDAWARIIENRYNNVEVKYTVYKKSDLTPEQIEEIERKNKETIENLGR